MADDFWKAVYDKLIDNMELLKLICRDTSNADLLAWVKPNSRLKTRCARYLKNGFIADREGIINEMLSYAKTDNPLRRIILLTWVDKNQASMAFFKIPGNQAAIERLGKGEFGNSEKIRILSYIDPREGSAKLYKDILEKADAEAKQKSEEEKAAQALAAMGTVDSAELEAALHAKEMIAVPDTKFGIDPRYCIARSNENVGIYPPIVRRKPMFNFMLRNENKKPINGNPMKIMAKGFIDDPLLEVVLSRYAREHENRTPHIERASDWKIVFVNASPMFSAIATRIDIP